MENTTYLPRTAVRRLQELVEEDKLDFKYEGKHRHAFYKIKDDVIIPKQNKDFIQGVGVIR